MLKKVKKIKNHFKTRIPKLTRAQRIKVKLIQAGISQQSIANELGIHKSVVSLVINGKRVSKTVDNWLKKNLGV